LDKTQLDPNNGAMTLLSEKIDFAKLTERHNDPEDDYHLDLNSVVCLGALWNNGNTCMEMSTVHLFLNVGPQLEVEGRCRYRRTVALPCVHPILA
jgi:hypothetical protein